MISARCTYDLGEVHTSTSGPNRSLARSPISHEMSGQRWSWRIFREWTCHIRKVVAHEMSGQRWSCVARRLQRADLGLEGN